MTASEDRAFIARLSERVERAEVERDRALATVTEVQARADREMQSWQYEREAYQRRCAAAEAQLRALGEAKDA